MQWLVLITVLLRTSTSAMADPAKFLIKPQDATVEKETSGPAKISFFCMVDGNPEPNIAWKRNGKDISRISRYVVHEENRMSTLRIEPIRNGDNNTVISCTADNGVAPPIEAKAKLTLLKAGDLPSGFPVITSHPRLKAVEKGRTAQVQCTAKGDPKPEIQWLRDLMPVDVGGNRRYSISTLGNPGSLIIQNSSDKVDEGKYECVARNKHGVMHSKAAHLYVKVRRVPPHFSIPPDRHYKVVPGGSLNLSCVAVGYPMPKVFWRQGHLQLEDEATAPVGKNVLYLTRIEQTTNYTCVAVSLLGNIEASTTVEVKDENYVNALPPPPNGLRVSNVTANTVSLRWEEVPGGKDAEVRHYVVQYRPKYTEGNEYEESEAIDDTKLIVTGLQPFQEYEFRVLTANSVGRGAASSPVHAETGEARPETPPQNVQARAIKAATIVVQWDPPEKPNGRITRYRVLYSMNLASPTGTWETHEVVDDSRLVTIPGLKPDSTYYVRVQAINSKGAGPSSDPATVITKLGIPGQPINVRAEADGPHTMKVSWENPSIPSQIAGYLIRHNGTKDGSFEEVELFSTTETEFKVGGSNPVGELKPDTWYSFEVAARSSRGRGAYSPPVVAKTSPSVPTGAPKVTKVEKLGPDSLRIFWEPPHRSKHNGQLNAYRIRWERVIGPGDQADEESATDDVHPTPTATSGDGMATQLSTKPRVYVIRNLRTWTLYRVTVAAGTSKGFGPESVPVEERTAEDVPTAPTNLRVDPVNATAVRVSWQRPNSPNGVLAGYNVYKEELKNGEIVQGTSKLVAQIRNADKMYSIVGNLKPNTEYAFRVTAVNPEGDGQFAVKRMVTGGMPPSPPTFMGLNVTNGDQASIKAKISWVEPKVTHGMKIKLYKLRYKPVDDIHYSQRQTVNREVEIDGLFMGRKYEFLLTAVNNDGESEPTKAFLETPVGIPEGPPLNIRWYFRKDQRLEFIWEPPAKNVRNGEIIRYKAVLSSDHMTMPMIKNILRVPTTNYLVDEKHSYKFQVSAGTAKGFGPPSPVVKIEPSLSAEVPTPSNVRGQGISDTEIVVQWDPIRNVDEYQVRYSKEPKTDTSDWNKKSVKASENPETILSGLDPVSDYAICVVAVRQERVGRCSEDRIKIVKSQAEFVVENLKVDDVRSKSVRLSWDYKGAGPVDFFIKRWGTKSYVDQNGERKNVTDFEGPVEEVRGRIQTSSRLENLREWTNYTFKVGVIRGSNQKEYWARPVKARTLAGPPPFLDPPVFVRAISSQQVEMRLKRASEEYGPVSHYFLVLVSANSTKLPESFTNWDLLEGTRGVSAMIPQEAYITANLTAERLGRLPQENGQQKGPIFKIGTGIAEGGISNGPLNRKATYKAFLRAFVDPSVSDKAEGKKQYMDSMYSQNFGSLRLAESVKSRKSENLWLIGPIVAILVITLIIGMLMVYWMRRKGKKKQPSTVKQGNISKVALGPTGPTETSKLLMSDTYANNMHVGATILPGYDPVRSGAINGFGGDPMEMRRLDAYLPAPNTAGMVTHPPIPITELAGHIERLKTNDNLLFSQEYESIETGQQFTWDHSNYEMNKPKNRYANVIAYDRSRVILNTIDGIQGSDYINANYIEGYGKEKAYIATQGPLPETFGDFWRMIWEQNTAMIVMLTKLEERTRVKCDQYWPHRGSAWYGMIQVTLYDTMELAHYTIRTLKIQKRGQNDVRDVRHMQFTAWPDHGVPDHPTPFLMFLKRVKSLNIPDSGSIVSHCSAGVGRTGAFIVIDCMLDRLRCESTVDIYGCVTTVRSQRNYMVQTEDQYVFIHDAVLDAVQSGSTEVPAGKLFTHIQALMQMQPLDNATGMELEFRHLAALRMPNARFSAANLPCNKQKNRLVNILPYDSTRVCLSPVPGGPEGSDYINASWVDGYRQRKSYIATQGPLSQTIEEFWRMLWEHNSCIIVVLTKLREMGREKCCQYWPSDRSEKYGALVVEPIAEYNMPQYVLREFKMTDTQSGQSRTIRHFQYTEWPEQGVPKSAELFVEFIGQVHKTKEQFGAEGPITVHCSAGVGRTGVFIALAIILERMRFENVVDVFTTVKLLRTQRSNMVQSEDQYHFCYQAALEYLGSFDHYAMQCE